MRRWIFACVLLLWALPVAVLAGPSAPEFTSVSPPAAVLGITHGAHIRPVFIPGAGASYYGYGNEIAAFNNLVGKDIGVVMYYAAWNPFDPFLPDTIQKQLPPSRRPVIMLTWEPHRFSTGCNLGYEGGSGPLVTIAQGRCDSYIRSFAQALKARPERYLLRLAHEMNISDTPWWPGHFGQGPDQYVTMWRRVHDIFVAQGVANVEWVWAPNYESSPLVAWNNLHAYYPGNDYVDWIGLSGYNWFNTRGRPWEDFGTLYDKVLRDLACRYPKPVIIAEMGTVEGDGNSPTKAQWIADAYARIPAYPHVRAVIWFNDYAYATRGQADFRVTTGSADCLLGGCQGVQPLPPGAGSWTRAYADSIASPVFTSRLPSLQAAAPPQVYCGGGPQFQVTPELVLVSSVTEAVALLTGQMFSTAQSVSVSAPAGIRVTLSDSRLDPPWDQVQMIFSADSIVPPGIYPVQVRVGTVDLTVQVKKVTAVHRVRLPSMRK